MPDALPPGISCSVSKSAIQGDPRLNKNYRNNPSLLIQTVGHKDNNDDSRAPPKVQTAIIDVGKTFREGALRWFPYFGIGSLDAIILTHHHMDAMGGLDDVRGFQKLLPFLPGSTRPRRNPMPLYLSKLCHKELQQRFPWLVPPPPEERQANMDDSKPVVKRDTASFDISVFENYMPMHVFDNLSVTPLPVWHGADLESHGFAFTLVGKSGKKLNVVYLSDISEMMPATLEFILNKLPKTDILIVDALLWEKPIPVHFSLKQALALRRTIQPTTATYFVGMNCDSMLSHDDMNQWLKANHEHEASGIVELAYDGLCVEVE